MRNLIVALLFPRLFGVMFSARSPWLPIILWNRSWNSSWLLKEWSTKILCWETESNINWNEVVINIWVKVWNTLSLILRVDLSSKALAKQTSSSIVSRAFEKCIGQDGGCGFWFEAETHARQTKARGREQGESFFDHKEGKEGRKEMLPLPMERTLFCSIPFYSITITFVLGF